MLQKLIKLSHKSKSHYSNFRVSTIIKTIKGEEIEGINFESSSFPAGTCAERVALGNLLSKGIDPKEVKEIHILGYSSKNEKNDFYIAPCGICRQVLNDYLNKEVKIFLYNKDKKDYKITNLKELLPLAFEGSEINE